MDVFESFCADVSHSVGRETRRGFTLTELLVAVAIILALGSMMAAAISAASGQGKKLRTRALIAKISEIVTAHYESFASQNVNTNPNDAVPERQERAISLRNIARGDLPDKWNVIEDLAARADETLTAQQRAYVAFWQSIDPAIERFIDRTKVADKNGSAECLFLAIMHGGLSNCFDCGSLHIDVGDTDSDSMPEFLDAWGNPIGFILEPKGLRLPAGSNRNFFSSTEPFEEVMEMRTLEKGGRMRPLIVSAGPDGELGLSADAAPVPGSAECRDNVTNFDEEARR